MGQRCLGLGWGLEAGAGKRRCRRERKAVKEGAQEGKRSKGREEREESAEGRVKENQPGSENKEESGSGEDEGKKVEFRSTPGLRSEVGAPQMPGGEPRQAGPPTIKERTGGRLEDLLGPAVPLSSEGIKNKLLRAST